MNDFNRDWRPKQSTPSVKLAGRLDELRSALRLRDPNLVAARSGASYLELGPDRGELHVPFWGNVCVLSFPELVGYNHDEHLSDFQQTLLLYYLVIADGTALTGKWVSLAGLPDGLMYNAAFQGYTGNEVVKTFGFDLEAFKSACVKAGGTQIGIGNTSFIFQALPHIPLTLTYWLGDEDFPSSCQVLFDESAVHYLPVDVCAISGSMLTQGVIRFHNQD
jgi:hypothetical protein